MHDDIPYIFALQNIPRLGNATIKKLIKKFDHARNIWDASPSKLSECGLQEGIIQHILYQKNRGNPIKNWHDLQLQDRIKTIGLSDPDYPTLLSEIHDPPPILFYQGSLFSLQRKTVSIVGTRNMSSYGKSCISEITQELKDLQVTIMSGLALGVDAFAHEAALQAQIPTCAVIASGHNNISPRSNLHIAEKILKTGGCILSEYIPDAKPTRYTFPQRNRITSGLSKLTIVIEAAKKSGALITAYQAIEQNRDVMAVPGSIFSETSAGCNELIKNGASPYTGGTSLHDILGIN